MVWFATLGADGLPVQCFQNGHPAMPPGTPRITDAQHDAFVVRASKAQISPGDFLKRFTDAERLAISTVSLASALLHMALIEGLANGAINLFDPATQGWVAGLAQAGAITAARVPVILDPSVLTLPAAPAASTTSSAPASGGSTTPASGSTATPAPSSGSSGGSTSTSSGGSSSTPPASSSGTAAQPASSSASSSPPPSSGSTAAAPASSGSTATATPAKP